MDYFSSNFAQNVKKTTTFPLDGGRRVRPDSETMFHICRHVTPLKNGRTASFKCVYEPVEERRASRVTEEEPGTNMQL